MGQDCNHRIFGTGLSDSIHLPRTGLSASETAITRLGLQSTVLGPHYMHLYVLTVLGPSFLVWKRLRIWGAPWRCSCLVCLWTWSRVRLTAPKTILLRHHNCLFPYVPCG